MNEPDYHTIIKSGKTKYVEIRRQTGKKTGIVICGDYDQVGFFHVKHYFPYVFSDVFTALEDVVVNKRVDTDAYTGGFNLQMAWATGAAAGRSMY